MARKMSIWATIAPFLCSFCIVGSGFALWQFNDVLETHASGIATVQIVAGAEEGKLSVVQNNNFSDYRLILEQKDGEFSQSGEGMYFIPAIDLLYTDFFVSENIIATLTGTAIISNNALSKYIEAKDYIAYDSLTSTYTFYQESISLVGKEDYRISIVPEFCYKKGMEPQTSDQYNEMIYAINDAFNNGYLCDINLEFSIDFHARGGVI